MRSTVRLFDGETPDGCKWPGCRRPRTGAAPPDRQSEASRRLGPPGPLVRERGALKGEQDVSGRARCYIVSEVFGDFALEIEACMDRPAATGIMLRATALGSQGFQVLVDHRKSDSIGGFTATGSMVFMPKLQRRRSYDEAGRPRAWARRPAHADGGQTRPFAFFGPAHRFLLGGGGSL